MPIGDFSPAMQSALAKLNKLIEQGVEFPDACWKVAQESGFMVGELRTAYDNHQVD